MSKVIQFAQAQNQRESGLDHSKVVFSLAVDDLVQPKNDTWLLSAVEGTRFEGAARSIWTHHPNLKNSTRKFASFITPYWPMKNGRPLLQHCVVGAVCNSIEALNRSEETTGRLVGIYLDSLAMGLADVARLVIVGTDANSQRHRWDYFSDALSEWAKAHQIVNVKAFATDGAPDPVTIAGLRMHLLARITHPHDAGYVAKYAGSAFRPDPISSNWGDLN